MAFAQSPRQLAVLDESAIFKEAHSETIAIAGAGLRSKLHEMLDMVRAHPEERRNALLENVVIVNNR